TSRNTMVIMGQIVPDPVERYLAGLNRLADPVLQDIALAGEKEDLPLVDAEVGGLLRILALAIGARRILEIGTAIGYSGIWLAGGLLVTGNVLWSGEVVPGFQTPTRDAADTRAIAEYNDRINAHPQLMTATIPLRDGVAIAVKRGSPELQPMLETLARASQAL